MSEWQPIETAPMDGTRVRLKFPGGYEGEGSWRTTYGGEWHVKSYTHLPWSSQDPATHWMPLPLPPGVNAENGGGHE